MHVIERFAENRDKDASNSSLPYLGKKFQGSDWLYKNPQHGSKQIRRIKTFWGYILVLGSVDHVSFDTCIKVDSHLMHGNFLLRYSYL